MGRIIGIDLGTSNSAAAVMDHDRPLIIPSAEGTSVGGKAFPSIVAFTKDGQRLVGEPARRQAVANPDRTVQAIKRKMGTKHRFEIGDKKYSPEELSAMILKKIKEDSENFLSEKIDKALKPAAKEEAEKAKTVEKVEKVDKLFDKGIELIEKEDFDGAIECFVKVIKKNPKNSKVWSNKGLAHNGNWEYEEAIKCFDIALELDPNDIIACFNKAVALNDFGKHEEAIECYNDVLRIDPDFDAEELNQILLEKFEKEAEKSD